jgi:TPR repeat protein
MKLSKMSSSVFLLFLATSPLVAAPETGAWNRELAVIEKAAGTGDARAQGILAQQIRVGQVKQSGKLSALELAKQSAAAGSPFGHFSLGRIYATGAGVEKDEKEAEKLYRKALDGLSKAAEMGDVWAMLWVSFCYEGGYGVNKDPVEATKWYRKAAEQGNASAQFDLGNSYYRGYGVNKDPVEATKWYRKAAEQGLVEAQFNLGNSYHRGDGVNKDPVEANKWYRKAAEQGLAAAQFNLGNSYDRGDGVNKDPVEANKWYRKAAEQGHADAQLNLGVSYQFGEGIEKDMSEALAWYRKAADQGNERALKNLSKINPQEALTRMNQAQNAKSREVKSRTVDSEAGRDGGPQTEDILVAVGAHAFGEGQVAIKRGEPLVSQGGRIPSGTRLFPVKISGNVAGLDAVFTFRFWKDEFGDWQHEQVKR